MGLTRAEQETVIRWDEDAKEVHIWTASPTIWRKLARLGIAPVRETTADGRPSGRFYRLPLSLFRWGLKRKGAGNAAALRALRALRAHRAVARA